jgi:hypothetical protein
MLLLAQGLPSAKACFLPLLKGFSPRTGLIPLSKISGQDGEWLDLGPCSVVVAVD